MESDAALLMRGYSLITVQVIYYLPDHRHLLNSFLWQTLDRSPRYPRIGRFLDHWRVSIDAIIKEVLLAEGGAGRPSDFRRVDDLIRH